MAKSPTHVYVISSECGRVKIGISSDPFERVFGLSTGSPRKLTLEHAELADDFPEHARRIEGWCHDILADHRVHGEWFEVSASEAVKIVRQVSLYVRNAIYSNHNMSDPNAAALKVSVEHPLSCFDIKLFWKNKDGSEEILSAMSVESTECLIDDLQEAIREAKARSPEEFDPRVIYVLSPDAQESMDGKDEAVATDLRASA